MPQRSANQSEYIHGASHSTCRSRNLVPALGYARHFATARALVGIAATFVAWLRMCNVYPGYLEGRGVGRVCLAAGARHGASENPVNETCCGATAT